MERMSDLTSIEQSLSMETVSPGHLRPFPTPPRIPRDSMNWGEHEASPFRKPGGTIAERRGVHISPLPIPQPPTPRSSRLSQRSLGTPCSYRSDLSEKERYDETSNAMKYVAVAGIVAAVGVGIGIVAHRYMRNSSKS